MVIGVIWGLCGGFIRVYWLGDVGFGDFRFLK